MQEFSSGPFVFSPKERVTYNGQALRYWVLSYGAEEVARHTLDVVLTQDAVREAFSDDISAFAQSAREEHAQAVLDLIDFETDEIIARLAVTSDPGLTNGLIDDRSRYWLRSVSRLRSLDVTLDRFAEIAVEHGAPSDAWIAGLLPDDVLTTNPDAWRAPTSWEIRHVVGEGGFTGISGAKAAALVGVTPQNFRKYTARDGAASRQDMSFAMWHLLLARLGIRRLAEAL